MVDRMLKSQLPTNQAFAAMVDRMLKSQLLTNQAFAAAHKIQCLACRLIGLSPLIGRKVGLDWIES